jgi:hypothetical protein
MVPQKRKKTAVSAMVPFLLFVILFSGMIWLKYRSSNEVKSVPSQQNEGGSRSVTLFFASEGRWLVRESRDIEPCDSDILCLKSTLEELLNGPVGDLDETVPDGTSVDSVNIEGKVATIELNKTFSDSMVSGSSAEMLSVYSVVNTVTANFPQIELVKLNVDNNKKTILNHLDLSEPLRSDYSLEQSKLPESEKIQIKPAK